MIKLITTLASLLILSSCSLITQPYLNEARSAKAQSVWQSTIPVTALDTKPQQISTSNRSDDLTLILTFSGGGTRAAAFSYGVLKELKDTHSPRYHKSLLDEVDLISSVSGGSFTAAYYGLYGNQLFTDYESRFLKRPVQSSLVKNLLLSPLNWIRLAPALYERSDLAADYYEKNIFGKKRFRDMRRSGPRIVINATDIATGQGFAFTNKNFNRLCSNLSSYPVGRAVVASSAVPVIFSPIVMKNYSDQCHTDSLSSIRETKLFKPYLHLIDGGVIDNLGIRSLLRLVEDNDNDFWKLMKTYKIMDNHQIVFIVVNASDAIPPQIGQTRRTPDTSNTLGAVATIQSKRYNQATLRLLEHQFSIWKSQVTKGRCAELKTPDCAHIDFQMAELNFNQLPEKLAKELSHYETSLELPAAQVDQLIQAGRQLLRQSPVFQQLLKRI